MSSEGEDSPAPAVEGQEGEENEPTDAVAVEQVPAGFSAVKLPQYTSECILKKFEERAEVSVGEVQSLCADLAEVIVTTDFESALHEKSLLERSAFASAQYAVNAALEVVDLFQMPCDSHKAEQPCSNSSSTNEFLLTGLWEADEDLAPGVPDSMARATVPTRRIAKPVPVTQEDMGRPGSADVASVGSRRSKRSGARPGSRDGVKRGGNAGQGSAAAQAAIQEDTSDQRRRTSTSSSRSAAAESAAASSRASPMDELRTSVKKRIDREAAQAKKAAQLEAEKVALEKYFKETRGKEVVMDISGKYVLATPVEPDKLSSTHVNPKQAVGQMQLSPDSSSRLKPVRGVPKRPVDQLFQALNTAQPSPLQTMKIRTGVTLREGGSSKSGPPAEKDDRHMSKADFAQLQETLNMGSAGEGAPVAAQTAVDTSAAAETSTVGMAASGQPPPSRGSMGSAGSARSVSLLGGHPTSGPYSHLPPALASAYAAGKVQELPRGGAVAVAAEASYDWSSPNRNVGDVPSIVEPGTMPSRAGVPVLRRQNVPPAVSKHLPPPVYPAVHGHGVMTGALARENPLASAGLSAYGSRGKGSPSSGKGFARSPVHGSATGKVDTVNPRLLKDVLRS